MPTSTPSAAHPAASSVRAAGADDVCYPCSDGKPMADDMWQGNAIRNAAGDLEAALPDALVAAPFWCTRSEATTATGSLRTCWWPSGSERTTA